MFFFLLDKISLKIKYFSHASDGSLKIVLLILKRLKLEIFN